MGDGTLSPAFEGRNWQRLLKVINTVLPWSDWCLWWIKSRCYSLSRQKPFSGRHEFEAGVIVVLPAQVAVKSRYCPWCRGWFHHSRSESSSGRAQDHFWTGRCKGTLRWNRSYQPKFEYYAREPAWFCAGVDRAISIVERALELFSPPIYVRHEVVHNRYVVQNLKDRGAVLSKS